MKHPEDAQTTTVVKDANTEGGVTAPRRTKAISRRSSITRRFLRDKFAVGGLVFIFVLVGVAIFADQLARFSPSDLWAGGAQRFEPPSSTHWLGTDDLGRDVASRLILGTRIALRDSIQVVVVTILLGVPIGIFAGFVGGTVDNLLMRLMDMIISVPGIIFVLAVAEITSQSLPWVLFALSVIYMPTLVRLVRASTLSVREEVFIEASLGIGTPLHRILFRRVLPNVTSPIIVQGSIFMGGAIFVQATLAILGIGYPVGTEAWGSMLNDAFRHVYASFWNMFYPGAMIALAILAFNLIGDGLRDSFGLDRGNLYGGSISMGLTLPMRAGRGAARGAQTIHPATRGTNDIASPVLAVRNLTIEVATQRGTPLTVVDDVSFSVSRGEVVGLVGESGAGKTVTSLSIMRLLPTPPFRIAEGSIAYNGRDLIPLPFHEMRRVRGNEIAMIFQDPMMGLNPSYTIGRQIAEVVELHEGATHRVAMRRAVEMLDRVGIPDARRRAHAYPHEFSGGMRQRAMIAIALACSPKLLIADEPTTALDVTVQAQILEVLRGLQQEFSLSVIFVTHDLGVVAEFCDRALVMYAGQVVEEAQVRDLFAHPSHPYTEGLLSAVPSIDKGGHPLQAIPGQVPPLGALPSGCRFHPRCPYAIDACTTGEMPTVEVNGSLSRCIRALDREKSEQR